MNYWPGKWDLDKAMCPCDVHFNEWTQRQRVTGKAIYHFGTGLHHIVGVQQAARGNSVLGITASIEEYESYIQLVVENAAVAKHYVAYFGDIYLTQPDLLPELDVVTLFHLCEYARPKTTSKAYGGLSDAELLDLLTVRTRVGGHLLFYADSNARQRSAEVIQRWAAETPVRYLGAFKSLLVYQKTGPETESRSAPKLGRKARPAAGRKAG
jgi:hypothetical protein